MRKAKGLSSELSMAKGSATVTCILAETQRQAEEWESFIVGGGGSGGNGSLHICPDWRLLPWKRCRWTD